MQCKLCRIWLQHPYWNLYRIPIGMLNRCCAGTIAGPGNDLQVLMNQRVERIMHHHR
jgi:hypothetical protein